MSMYLWAALAVVLFALLWRFVGNKRKAWKERNEGQVVYPCPACGAVPCVCFGPAVPA